MSTVRGGDEVTFRKGKIMAGRCTWGVNYSGLKVPEAKGGNCRAERGRFLLEGFSGDQRGWLLCQRRFCAVAAQTVYRRAKDKEGYC